MKKKPSFIIFNDIHIKSGIESDVYNGVKYLVERANELGIKEVVLNGDVFDSRSFQRLSYLKCFEKMLDLFKANCIVCHTVVGNHDKSIYTSEDSFIEPFKYHPSIRLYSTITDVVINGIGVTMSPFFTDKIIEEQLKGSSGNDVLIGHYSVDGSTYLGKIDSNKAINKKLLSKWKKVYLGHYHNAHEITKNIVHLPSLLQDSFGEDNNKGFSIIYDDLSYEIIKGKFKELVKVVIDLNKESILGVKKLIKDYYNSPNTVRFEFIGDESKLKSLDKSLFKDSGIDVKLKFDKKYDFESAKKQPIVVRSYGKGEIEIEFEKFCNKKGYDYVFGKSLLDKFFKNK